MHPVRKVRRSTKFLVALGFILSITLPSLDLLFNLDPTPDSSQPFLFKQAFGFRDLLKLPGTLKYWFNNNFGFSDFLAETNGRLHFELLGISPNARVLPGQTPWLFLRDEKALDAYRNIYPFREKDLQTWIKMLSSRAKVCESMHIPYLFMVAPSKPTIYGSRLPKGWEPVSTISRLDQLNSAIASHAPFFQTIDLRPVLLKAAKYHRIYYHTDTHWNELGAFAAVKAIHQSLGQHFPELGSMETPIGVETIRRPFGGDLARIMGLKHILHETELRPALPSRPVFTEGNRLLELELLDGPSFDRLVTLCPRAPLTSAVVFHDSFGKVMIPYLSRLFKRTVFIWRNQFDGAIVAQERPQVVLQEIVERRLLNWEQPSDDDKTSAEASKTERLNGFVRHHLPGGRRLFLLMPESRPAPAVVLVHGGGWRQGHPSEQEAVARELASKGYAVALPDYRLLKGRVTVEDQVADVYAAVKWLRDNRDELDLAPTRMAVAGSSAGGHLAFLATIETLRWGESPDALVLLAPVLDTTVSGIATEVLGDRAGELSPIKKVAGSLPPILVIHARDDDVIPFEGVGRFIDAARSVGVKVEVLELPEGGHGFSIQPASWVATLDAFLRRHLFLPDEHPNSAR